MKQPIRVLHIVQRMEAGGTQALLMNIYRNIDREKVQFDFLVMYPEKYFYDDEIVSLGGKVYYSTVRKDKNVLKFQNQLKKLINENSYKIVHAHAYSIGYFALRIAKKCGVPVRIAHSHSNKILHNKRFFAKKILQKIYKLYATDLMACSEEAGRFMFGKKKFIVLKNAIDLERYIDIDINNDIKRAQIGLKEKDFVIGTIGRLEKEKNQLFLIDILEEVSRQNKNAKLLIIGSGSQKESIINYSKDKNLDKRVIILSNRKDIPELLKIMDVFVLPSLYEGLGIAAIEAQATGLPVVLSDGVSKEAIVTNNVKVVSLRKNANEWAKQILSSKAIDTNVEEKIRKAGFDIKEQADWLESYYVKRYVDE